MILTDAPLFSDMADGPAGAKGYWLTASDGIKLRVGHFPSEGRKGTILMFPGRTEYVEKYGRTAADFADHGYHMLAIDWRGQGLADRLVANPLIGHVAKFTDYQLDVSAMVRAAEALDLPRPWYLLAHSMGGAIGLRAVMDGLPVEGCAFSAPMWGILLPQPLRPVAYTISMCATQLGCGNAIAPSTRAESYLLTEPFENNKLTRDREMYDYMRSHVELEPRLGLGGPSLRWLYQALTEGNQLARRPSPAMPCLTWLGSDEQIVDPARIQTRMANWPCGKLEVVEDGRHEMLMEDRALRRSIVDRTLDFFEHSDANTPCRAKEA